jgi:hypothetical protein
LKKLFFFSLLLFSNAIMEFCVCIMITGNHAIGTVRKFPTLPLNANGVWIDPAGGVWRQATDVQNITANGIKPGDGTQPPQLPLPDYER